MLQWITARRFQNSVNSYRHMSAMILFKSPLAEVLPSLYQALRNFIGVQCEDQVITPVAIDV